MASANKKGPASQSQNISGATPLVLDFKELDKTKLAIAGGKGANLGELSQIAGIQVPRGFCITTEAYKEITGNSARFNALLNELVHLKADNRKGIAEISTKIRKAIEQITIPADLENEVIRHLEQHGQQDAYAVRSSATAEDLPTASFAGQQDTYLNIIGEQEILMHISKCWASLFTERAVIYRLQNGFGHRKVHLSVVIQKMVFPDAAGILFTADPLTGNRKVLSVDAGFGLGEAMVSGLVNADNYKVREGQITDKKVPAKKFAIYALKDGGTEEQKIGPELQNSQVLTDEQILQLEQLGRKIERHFGQPQDVEWCLVNNEFYIVQSRPITTLYPVPEVNDDEKHVYLSVGHQQMMTDAMKPLGLSLHQMVAARPMYKAGGRLFVDIAQQLASPVSRAMMIEAMGQHDPLIKDAIVSLLERGDFISSPAAGRQQPVPIQNNDTPPVPPRLKIENDPAIVTALIKRSEESVEELRQNIRGKSGPELFDFIVEDLHELKKVLFDPQSTAVFMAAIDASLWLNEKMNEWLGEKSVADVLSLSVPNNITSEMGLALLDVADVIRPYPKVIDYLQHVKQPDFLDKLTEIDGGQQARNAIESFLDKYGMRCAGEIDITNARWSENPAILIPMILNNVKSFEPGAAARKFEEGRQQALNKEQELLHRLKQLPGGEEKVEETKRMIGLVRNYIGYREYPKYGKISRYRIYKQAIMREARALAQAGIIRDAEDIYYLTFEELREAVRTKQLDHDLIASRRETHKFHKKLTPPRVITSDGEIITGTYKRDNLPAGAIVGLGVSSGIIEGRARVILKMEDADIAEGDILVTTFTDPSWTPLFISIKGLVTEVGGMMTHGAVVAREYGLPAVVGVEDATRLIKDGQRIRVNGTDGFIEIL